MSGESVSLLYTYMAVASFISRHLFCKLGDFPYFNRFYLYQGGMTISGLCIISIPVARSFVTILIPLMGFALMDGSLAGQQSLLVLECVGHHNLNHAWGYMMLFAGISASVGPPSVGKLNLMLQLQVMDWKLSLFNSHHKQSTHFYLVHLWNDVFLIGLMADMLGSYTIPFYTTGVVLIVGASITSLMTCVNQQSEEIDAHIVQSEVEEISVTEKITVL